MKKLLIVCAFALLFSLPTFAQDVPSWEVFGGYSYLRSDPGALPAANTSGWNAAVNWNWNKWLGVKADLDGHYCCDGQNMHDFLFGPQFTLHRGKVQPFLHGLVGLSVGRSSTFSENVFATALGGGLDVKATDRISIRVVQADWLGTHYSDDLQSNVRVSTGIVFHFGKK